MAGSVNKVILIGNLGADPEVRHTQDGRPIVNLRVATARPGATRRAASGASAPSGTASSFSAKALPVSPSNI